MQDQPRFGRSGKRELARFGPGAGPAQWTSCPLTEACRQLSPGLWSLEALTSELGLPLRLGDLLPAGGHRPRVYTIDAFQSEEHALVDVVPPADLKLYQVLASRRPVGRSHLATVPDRENCILLAAAFFLDLRKSQIDVFTARGERLALTPPCSRCALPTGSWCDICGRPLCTRCDDEGITPCCSACAAPAHSGQSGRERARQQARGA